MTILPTLLSLLRYLSFFPPTFFTTSSCQMFAVRSNLTFFSFFTPYFTFFHLLLSSSLSPYSTVRATNNHKSKPLQTSQAMECILQLI
jgi:hypothetical protein